ncbi:SDR family NAD(P)-dependent oxidoreductase [Pedobacter psychroterrae]|uniref:SDR family oxidoreductase n=1 Tax=Pedobacter psychroterrae TaxID=2530453 RepID=A0A4R0N9K2_9SPHI|nr:SDR family oxidoreductase [Pedobacter psychroterrae]TCC96871.1 SDR family oxidoreductase [Pedobacter psychroterrae]
MKGLAGKVAIVTGGSSGIGRACVERLCSEGVSVTFSGISAAGIKTEQELAERGFAVQFLQGDMADEAFCKSLVAAAVSKWGSLHFLVNNAFSFVSKGTDVTREDWDRVMHAGPVAYGTMAKYAAPHMSAGGAIVNVSSISAHIAQPGRWTYNAAKGAVTQLTKCMAMDLAPNIRVNAVSPAWIWTKEVEKAAIGGRDKWEPVWGKFHLLRRLGEVEECSGPIAFLLSDEASFISGADLYIDGGYLTMGGEGLGETSSFAGSL